MGVYGMYVSEFSCEIWGRRKEVKVGKGPVTMEGSCKFVMSRLMR